MDVMIETSGGGRHGNASEHGSGGPTWRRDPVDGDERRDETEGSELNTFGKPRRTLRPPFGTSDVHYLNVRCRQLDVSGADETRSEVGRDPDDSSGDEDSEEEEDEDSEEEGKDGENVWYDFGGKVRRRRSKVYDSVVQELVELAKESRGNLKGWLADVTPDGGSSSGDEDDRDSGDEEEETALGSGDASSRDRQEDGGEEWVSIMVERRTTTT